MHHRHHVRSCGRRSGNSRLHSRLRGSLGGVALCAALASGLAFAQDTSPSGAGGVTGEQITKVLGLDGKNLGTGMHFKLGIVLALTGPGSYYGRIQGNGAKLAVAQIKAAGGPDIDWCSRITNRPTRRPALAPPASSASTAFRRC
jgi:hypothetical protein